jgi:glycosyltransferase involved in cell wall biosynthesis
VARVLVASGDVVPAGGGAATGAGLRALGLGEGLRARGHEVTYVMPEEHRARLGAEAGLAFYGAEGLDGLLAAHDPDVLVLQHWPLAGMVSAGHRARLVIDFHGPLMLETLFRHPESIGPYAPMKLQALARADFFTCASERQRYYYAAFLLAAGIDLREPPIAVIPFSMPPELPERQGWPSPPVFVYGGVLLPWQDPSAGLIALVSELEAAGAGELRMYGGNHPWMELGLEGRVAELEERLGGSERVSFPGMLPRTELVGEYAAATVAWDLMARNLERDLAFTSRTVEYLWCGLPVVYNDYAELAEYIRRADAGWTVDPEDEDAIRQVVRQILAEPETVRRKGENARQLVRRELAWDVSIGPLDDFCRSPRPAGRLAEGPLLTDPAAIPPPADVVRSGASSLRGFLHAVTPASARRAARRALGRSGA